MALVNKKVLWQGYMFIDWSLSFGLLSSAVLLIWWHGCHLLQYHGNFLLFEKLGTLAEASHAVAMVWEVYAEAVAELKTERHATFLGILINAVHFQLWFPLDKQAGLRMMVHQGLDCRSCTRC